MQRKVTAILLSVFFSVATMLVARSDGPPEPLSPEADGTLPSLQAIAGQGMMGSHAYSYLEELSDDIGGRVTGTPAGARAIEWGVAKMKAIGLKNVHTEKFELKTGWSRVSANAELVSPIARPLKVDSMGWVGSTPEGGVEADVVPVNVYNLDEEIKKNAPT